MKIKKFRIKNYKSIVDSGDCYLTDTITILAGKNESGKTSILEALEDFNPGKKIRESAKPIKSPEEMPKISITFVVEKEILEEILEEMESPVKAIADVDIEIIKTFPNKYRYRFEDLALHNQILRNKEVEKTQKSIKDKWEWVGMIHGKYEGLTGNLFDFEFSNFENNRTLFTGFMNEVAPNVDQITDEKEREYFSECLAEIQKSIDDLTNFLATRAKFWEEWKQWMPNFILFSSFEDIFPNKIPFAELEENEWIKDLSVISDLDIPTIKGTDDRGKEKHKDDINIKLNKDYEKFWTQDASDLSVTWSSEHLFFWIKENGYPYEPSMRSKGRQWHLAFYIKISARANEDVANIILIDEPGLFLHAKAQEDILGKLEDSAKEVQVIFSTHSPYLLEADKLNRVKLIHRTDEKGTQVENKIHALADKETLTPILTTIGLELNAGISVLGRKNNVIVEGPSDVFYLNAFKKILKRDSVNFIFGGGAGNMPFVGTILHGWGGKVVYLYDNDKGKKHGKKNLKNNWLMPEDLILSVLKTAGSIEDIFSPSDFKKFILNNTSIAYAEKSSEYVQRTKLDKVLLAKKFLEACQSGAPINLEKETTDNITELIKTIESKF